MFEATQEAASAARLPAYEISNHARPGAESRHNLIYWRYGDYAGIGPGAHGRLTVDGRKVATQRVRSPEAWCKQVETYGHGAEPDDPLDAETQFAEMMLMGLRLTEGVPERRIRAVRCRSIDTAFDENRLHTLIENELLERTPDGLRATPDGRARLDAVIAHLLG